MVMVTKSNRTRQSINVERASKCKLFKAVTANQKYKQNTRAPCIYLMSDYEGMPVALMEGMASGIVPVCLQEESGINEIIKHGVNGFIVKDRDKDYQDKLQLLFNDVTLWETLSKNAIATIKHTYSSEITHKKWFELLSCFESLTTKQLRLPITIKVEGDQLPYGDYRKPSIKTRIKQQCTHNWLAFKMAVRPRARLKSFLKK